MVSLCGLRGPALAAVLLLLLASCRVSSADLDGFEDDDSDTRPSSSGFRDVPEEPVQEEAKPRRQQQRQDPPEYSLNKAAGGTGKPASDAPPVARPPPVLPFPANLVQRFLPTGQQAPLNMQSEAALSVLFAIYMINLGIGRRRNRRIADAFVRVFATPGDAQLPCSLHRQFAGVHGADNRDGPLIVESMSQYKLYATGRRHCQFLIATLNLRARQDLISQVWYLVQPAEDTLFVEVAVADMPPLVLAAATPRVARRLAADARDVGAFTHRINAPSDQMPGWPTDRVHILGEHSAVAYDLLGGDPKVAAVLAADAAGPRLFRALHFSSELTTSAAAAAPATDANGAAALPNNPFSAPLATPSSLPPGTKCALRFEFALPAAKDMGALAGLMALVPLMVDAVGSYRPTADLRKKLAEQRQKTEDRSAKERAASEEIATKLRESKMVAEKEKLARMTPDARAKMLEKQDRRNREKQQKKMTRKI